MTDKENEDTAFDDLAESGGLVEAMNEVSEVIKLLEKDRELTPEIINSKYGDEHEQ